jgi:hypothetical protein
MKLTSLALALVFLAPTLDAADVSSKEIRSYTRELKFLLKTGNTFDLEDFIVKIGELDHPKLAVLLPPAGARLPSATNYKRAVEAIKDLENAESVAAIVEYLDQKKTSYQEKVLVLEAFGFRKDPASLACLVTHIGHKISHVRLTAIRTGLARREKEMVPALIEAVKSHEKNRDLTWLEARESLLAITGQDFDNSEDWEKWWGGNGEGFDPTKVGEETGKTRVVVQKKKDTVEFFGAEIFSRNVLFVIDVSGSMLKYDEGDYRGRNVEEDRRRMRRARIQLSRAVRMLPRSARFNIIAFSDKVLPWQKTLKTASKGSVVSALKFVNKFIARGATHTDDAMTMAFRDHNVDTIVFLSDGAPMKRDARLPQPLIAKILKFVRDKNASRKIRINAFGFEGMGQWPQKAPGLPSGPKPQPSPEDVAAFIEFMKTLAKENRGIYRAIN